MSNYSDSWFRIVRRMLCRTALSGSRCFEGISRTTRLRAGRSHGEDLAVGHGTKIPLARSTYFATSWIDLGSRCFGPIPVLDGLQSQVFSLRPSKPQTFLQSGATNGTTARICQAPGRPGGVARHEFEDHDAQRPPIHSLAVCSFGEETECISVVKQFSWAWFQFSVVHFV